MVKRHIYYCLMLALLVTGLYNIFMPHSIYHSEQHLKVGQIAEKDIIAPFDFPVLKTQQQLNLEKQNLAKRLKPIYQLSDEIQFDATKTLNDIFIPLIKQDSKLDTASVRNNLNSWKINISNKSAVLLLNQSFCRSLYELLHRELPIIYQQGIYDILPSDSVNVYKNGELVLTAVANLISVKEGIALIINKIDESAKRSVLAEILPALVQPNLIKDQKRFNEYVEQRAALIPQAVGNITKNEILVRSNARITEDDVNKIRSLVLATQERSYHVSLWKSLSVSLSFFLYYFILGLILYYYYRYFYRGLLNRRYHFSPMIAGLAINAMLAILNNQILGLQTLLIPYSMTIITAAILIDVPFALFYNFLSFASIYPFVNWETFSPLVLVLSTSGVLLLMNKLNDKHQYFTIWVYHVLTTAGLTLIFAMYNIESLIIVIGNMGYAFISSTLSIIVVIFLVPFLEKKWNMATRQQLLELLDFSHPLLKKLTTNAVGTYYHSLIVGNLAERAAEAIGADALLARVGSYYHDIGKIDNPDFFTENNPESAVIHDNMSPSESAKVIKNHVIDGLMLAKKYKIPSSVQDIILQHHGTGYIKYFLDKAEKSKMPYDLNQYRYSGPKPKSREAALVMIADIVESVAKSWDEINPEDIRKILNETIFRLIKEGQFDESSITMNDLTKVKDSMIPVLESIYRKRQQYPDDVPDYE